jgi:propanol-preferring alcohol dehydrogenase
MKPAKKKMGSSHGNHEGRGDWPVKPTPPFIPGHEGIGSIVGTRKDLADVFALHAAGRTKVIAESRHLEDVNACIDDVLAGRVPARLVFTF